MAGIQIGGMASGFDTDAIVKELVQAEQIKIDTVIQKRLKLEDQKEAYAKINNSYGEFVTSMRKLFGVENYVSMSGGLRPSTVNNLNWVNKTTSSNDRLISAKATSAATVGSYNFTVKQLAKGVSLASSSNIQKPSGEKIQSTDNFKEALGIEGNFVIETQAGRFDSATDLDGTETVDAVLKKINQATNMTFSFDYDLGRLFVKSNEMGEGSTLSITSDGNRGFIEAFGLENQITNGEVLKGQDAIIDFNGANDLRFNSNKMTIQGIELQLNVADVNETVTINVDTNIEGILEKVNEFAKAYNELVTDIGKKLKEAKYNDFAPLTDAQKDEMTEKEIELWEAKSKSGLLRNDSIINNIQNNMRNAFLEPIKLSNGTHLNLYDIGIGTKSYFEGGSNGEIAIDEEKLRAALMNDSTSIVEGLFKVPSDNNLNVNDGSLSASQIAQKKSESGIFNRLTNSIINGMGEIISKAGVLDNEASLRQVSSNILLDFTKAGSTSLLDSSIADFKSRINRLNDRLSSLESRYWKQFTAMESAIAKMNSQMSSFANL